MIYRYLDIPEELRRFCQFSPGMGPPVFGHMGPLAEMTLGRFQTGKELTIDAH
jgi:hypothetical protein